MMLTITKPDFMIKMDSCFQNMGYFSTHNCNTANDGEKID